MERRNTASGQTRAETIGIADGGIDAGLICLKAAQRPGQKFTHQDIAFVCGCSRTFIFLVEKAALRKIREKLRRSVGLSIEEFYGRNRGQI